MAKMKQTKALHCKNSDYALSQPKALKVSARKYVRKAAKKQIKRVHKAAAHVSAKEDIITCKSASNAYS